MDVMYREIGEVSETTISELLSVISDVKWECHINDVTDHQAGICKEQLQSVDEIVDRWPIDTWHQMLFLRLGPGGKLYRHHDDGNGFHIPVETNDGAVSLMYPNGGKTVQHLDVGKIYSVDRSIEHESFNNGDTDRTHLIVLLKEQSDG